MSARVDRRRFLELAAMTAAGGMFAACAPSAPRTASNPTAEPGKPAEAAKPTEAAKPAAPAATQAPLSVSGAAPTAAPAAPAAAPTAAPAAASAPAGKYKEAPQLADLVKQGKLPPVEKRLPENPRVLKPLEEVGQYGGTWHRAFRGLA